MPKAIPFVFKHYYGGYKIYCLHYTEFKLSGRNGCFVFVWFWVLKSKGYGLHCFAFGFSVSRGEFRDSTSN